MKKKLRSFGKGKGFRDDDTGKPDLIETTSTYAEYRYGQYMTGKKKRYGDGNFKKGLSQEEYLKSLKRHVLKLQALWDCKKYGLPIASWMEPNEDHACAIRFNSDGFVHEEEVTKLKQP